MNTMTSDHAVRPSPGQAVRLPALARGWAAGAIILSLSGIFAVLAGAAAQQPQPAGTPRVAIPGSAPTPPPIYTSRELADAELAALDAETVLAYWTEQEEKWNAAVAAAAMTGLNTEQEQAYRRQAMNLYFRAQTARQDAGLQRERSAKRLESMRRVNDEIVAQAR
ncbi:MAG: hypothetical protein ACK51N_03785 [bacterium]|jgi:hypothetical protein|nr:hypothetical protein [Phycisphaerales bacterium]MCE2653843.1 hypothetical protein [Planctomycetaceae bacterium]